MQLISSFGGFLLATLAASVVSASVIPSPPSAGSFEVKRSANKQFVGRYGALAMYRVYQKYKVPIPKALALAASQQIATRNTRARKRAYDSVAAIPVALDVEYNVEVQVGTPPKAFTMDFDTGSADTWFFSTGMTGSTNGHTLYDPSSSSSSKPLDGATWQISYGDNSSSSGDVYLDVVNVGGLTVIDQAVEAAKQVSKEFAEGQSDGIFGLAFGKINFIKPVAQKTFFENIAPALDESVLVADLQHSAPGRYVFGTIPPEVTNIQWTPCDNSGGFWGFSPVSGPGSAPPSTDKFSAIVDTGTTLLVLDSQAAQAYYSNIPGAHVDDSQGGWVFDCSAVVPPFTFQVSQGGGSITIPSDFLIYGRTSSGECFGSIQSMAGVPFEIYGDIAIKAAYVILDAGENRIGWAQKA